MGDYGFKVSKPGFDVESAADKDLVYSSKWGTFTVFATGGTTLSYTTGSANTVTIAHNLGYRPAFAVYSEVPFTTGFVLLPRVIPGATDRTAIPYCDSTNLYIRYGPSFHTSNGSFDYKYFIYYNRAI